MDISTLERDGWNRISFYSSLYDFEDIKAFGGIRTPAHKFQHTGRTAAIELVKAGYLERDDAEIFSTTILTKMDPGTFNGPAVALAFTTYLREINDYLVEPQKTARGTMLEIQKRKCWKTLVKKIKEKTDPSLNSFIQQYGITAPDLLRYFRMLQRRQDLLGRST